MAKRRYTTGTIIRKLREALALQGQGQTIALAVKQLSITGQILTASAGGSAVCGSARSRETSQPGVAQTRHVARRRKSGRLRASYLPSRGRVPGRQRALTQPLEDQATIQCLGFRPPAPIVVVPKAEKQSLETD